MGYYGKLYRSIQSFDALSYETEVDLELNGEQLTISIENDLEVIHENRYNSKLAGSEWAWESTGNRTFRGGDRWKIGYYNDDDAPNLEKLVDTQIIGGGGGILTFTKDEVLGVLQYLREKGVMFKETE